MEMTSVTLQWEVPFNLGFFLRFMKELTALKRARSTVLVVGRSFGFPRFPRASLSTLSEIKLQYW